MDCVNYEFFREKFIHYFEKYDIQFTERTIKKFFLFYERIIIENKKYNLTAITDVDGAIVKHFVDSVVMVGCFDIEQNAKIIDIGTGAGFPGIPLHIIRNDLNIIFLDSSAKKINFIKETSSILGVQEMAGGELGFVCGRAEEEARQEKHREAYDFAVSRAVSSLNVLCELAAPFVAVGGSLISYKGRNAETELKRAKNALKILGLEVAKIQNFSIAVKDAENNISEENRRVLINIKKIRHIDEIYPRNFSKIIKNPL